MQRLNWSIAPQRVSSLRKVFPTLYSRGGFTLIELLVVIAIIAILAAILFPVFSQAREKARQSTCVNNLKQLGLSFVQYTQDYDEMIPRTRYGIRCPFGRYRWMEVILPYCKNTQLYDCPSYTVLVQYVKRYEPDNDVTDCNWPETPTHSGASISYGANLAYWCPDGSGQPGDYPYSTNFPMNKHLAQVVVPADTFLLWDHWWFESGWTSKEGEPCSQPVDYDDTTNPPVLINATRGWVLHARHLKGISFNYCDGHSKWLNIQTILKANANGILPPFTIEDD